MSDATKNSTEAIAAYPFADPDGSRWTGDFNFQQNRLQKAFAAGWDAAKADLPDRETLVLAMIQSDALSDAVRAEAMQEGSTQREPFLMFADAVLALFRGEEPK